MRTLPKMIKTMASETAFWQNSNRSTGESWGLEVANAVALRKKTGWTEFRIRRTKKAHTLAIYSLRRIISSSLLDTSSLIMASMSLKKVLSRKLNMN